MAFSQRENLQDSVKGRYGSSLQDNDVERPITHLPRTIKDLLALSDEQKLLLAVVTASGCDAVAYYKRDGAGKLALDKHIDLYPAQNTEFPSHVNFESHSYATDDKLRESAYYHLAVPQTGGVVVLHAPTYSYSRVQSAEEATDRHDLHEPAAIRRAKLDMAAYILDSHSDLLKIPGESHGERILRQKHNRNHDLLPEKIEYFQNLIDHMERTLGTGSIQVPHYHGVSEMMMNAVDMAVNQPGQKPRIDAHQRELLRLATQLHDVGKTQLATPMLMPWHDNPNFNTPSEIEYSRSINHNHPLFTMLMLMFYREEAVEMAAHHVGLFRYTDKTLKMILGDKADDFQLLKDNFSFADLSPVSRMLRVCDVAEAHMCRGNHSLSNTMLSLAKRAGYHKDSNTVQAVSSDAEYIDPEMFCMMLDSGVFEAFAKTHIPAEKYDTQNAERARAQILEAFGWKNHGQNAAKLRDSFISDPLLAKHASKVIAFP